MSDFEQSIKPGVVIAAEKEGTPAPLKVQIVTGDGRVVLSLVGDRRRPIITTEEVLAHGGEVDSKVGKIVVPGSLRPIQPDETLEEYCKRNPRALFGTFDKQIS